MENNQHHRFYDILSDYSNYFYKHKDNDKLEAEYILNENKYNVNGSLTCAKLVPKVKR